MVAVVNGVRRERGGAGDEINEYNVNAALQASAHQWLAGRNMSRSRRELRARGFLIALKKEAHLRMISIVHVRVL